MNARNKSTLVFKSRLYLVTRKINNLQTSTMQKTLFETCIYITMKVGVESSNLNTIKHITKTTLMLRMIKPRDCVFLVYCIFNIPCKT